jgi:hypothetical protein
MPHKRLRGTLSYDTYQPDLIAPLGERPTFCTGIVGNKTRRLLGGMSYSLSFR